MIFLAHTTCILVLYMTTQTTAQTTAHTSGYKARGSRNGPEGLSNWLARAIAARGTRGSVTTN